MKALFAILLAVSSPLAFAASAVSGEGLISLLVTLVVVGLICYLLWWFIGYIGLPAPFDKVARVIVALIALIFLLNVLMSMIGTPFIRW